MAALQAAHRLGADEAFKRDLAHRLHATHRHALDRLDDETIMQLVAAGCRKAALHGLEAHAEQAAFVALMFAVSPDFDLHPAVRSVLSDQALVPAARMRLLPRLVPDHVWRQISQSLDAAAVVRWLQRE
jgi:hypothetical protein